MSCVGRDWFESSISLLDYLNLYAKTRDCPIVRLYVLLHGKKKMIHTIAKSAVDQKHHIEFFLEQSDFGIRPYQAMFGALRVQDRVKLEVIVSL